MDDLALAKHAAPVGTPCLVEQLEGPGSGADIEGWAEALEATNACAICGTTIVDPSAFAEAALRHYQADDDGELQEQAAKDD